MRSVLFLCLCSLGCLPAESLFQVCETNDDCAGECRNGRCVDNAESLDGISGEGGSESTGSGMHDGGAREEATDSERQDDEATTSAGADAAMNDADDAADPEVGLYTQSGDMGIETDAPLENTGDAGEAETEHDDGGIDETESEETTGTPLTCLEDTPPLPDTAVSAPFSPMVRIVRAEIPADLESANQAGCLTIGRSNGSGLNGILRLLEIEDLNTFFDPNDPTSIKLLWQLSGWRAGQRGGQVDDLVLKAYLGQSGDDGLYISRNGLDDSGASIIQLPGTIEGCLLTTEAGAFHLPLSAMDTQIDINLEGAFVTGQVVVEEDGVHISEGTVNGYFTRESVTALVEDLKRQCESTSPPEFCESFQSFLSLPVNSLVNILVGFAGGFDVSFASSNGQPRRCSGSDCDAISVCLSVEGRSASVRGLAQITNDDTDQNDTSSGDDDDGSGGSEGQAGNDSDQGGSGLDFTPICGDNPNLDQLTGACLGDADRAQICSVGDGLLTQTVGCLFECRVSDLTTSACVSPCVATATGLSANCSECFGNAAECVEMFCAGSLTDPVCFETHCSAPFSSCAGLPL